MAEKEERKPRVELQIIEKPHEHAYKEQGGELHHSPANSAHGDEVDGNEEIFYDKVLGCLHRNTKPRSWAIYILLWPYPFSLRAFGVCFGTFQVKSFSYTIFMQLRRILDFERLWKQGSEFRWGSGLNDMASYCLPHQWCSYCDTCRIRSQNSCVKSPLT